MVISQVLRGPRELTPEQAVRVAKFMGFGSLERDYFLTLVLKNRAGSEDLKNVFEERLLQLRKSANTLKTRIAHSQFSEKEQAIYYSNWFYSAVRLGISIPDLGSPSRIAEKLRLEPEEVVRILGFLLDHHLLVQTKNGYELGPQVTHVGADSPFVNKHHSNWRVKSLQAMDKRIEKNLFYTGPMALSKQAAKDIRSRLVSVIELSTQMARDSKSEELMCLNLDWFRVTET